MAKREAKPVQVWPVNPTGPFLAIRWERQEDWVRVCEFAGWQTGNTTDEVDCLMADGEEFHVGDWLVLLPSGKKALTDAEFRERFTVENKHGKA